MTQKHKPIATTCADCRFNTTPKNRRATWPSKCTLSGLYKNPNTSACQYAKATWPTASAKPEKETQ